MTQGEIIHSPLGREQLVALAREAGLQEIVEQTATHIIVKNMDEAALERFAALVREDEREKQQEPVAWMKNQFITDDAGFNIGTDDPEVHFGKDCPEDSGWWPVYAETISTQKPVVFRYKEYPLDTRSSWHYVTKRKAIPDGFPFQELYTTPPTAAQAARQMRDAAVKVCRDKEKEFSGDAWEASFFVIAANAIAALPVPSCASNASLDVQWRDLTDDETKKVIRSCITHTLEEFARAVIAKFKEKQL